MLITYIVLSFLALLISVTVSPIIIKLSVRYGIYDSSSSRKIHNGEIPRLGGLAIFIAFFPLSIYIISNGYHGYNINLFIPGMILSFFCGFLDDMVRIRGRYKLLLQIAAASLVAASGLLIKDFRLYTMFYVEFGYLAYPITVFWIVSFMNAVNLIDGMDGLSSGIVLIANLFIIIISAMTQNYHVLTFSLILEFSIIGFYIFNFPPAKIFIGDGGAYFIGFMYAVMPLMGIKKSAALTVFLIPMILLLVPICDVLLVMLKRFKNGKNLFHPDKNHLHHRLINLGFSNKGILAVVYGYTAVLGIFSLIMVSAKPEMTMILFGFILLILGISIVVLRKAERVIDDLKNENSFKPVIEKVRGKADIVFLKRKIG